METQYFALYIIIGLTVLISYKGFNDPVFFNKFLFNIGAIKAGEKYRNISSGFLHADYMHLVFNMLTLYFFAPIVINEFDSYKFILIYVASLLLGSFLSFYFHNSNNHYNAIGASGAVTGILYSAITIYPEIELYLYFAIPIKGWVFGVLYLIFSIYGMKKSLGNIGHSAHFGGAIAGYIITLILKPELIFTAPLLTLLIGLPIPILFILIKMNKI